VMYEDSSLQSQVTASAMVSGPPSSPIGITDPAFSTSSGFSLNLASVIGVIMNPGATVLTLMFWSPNVTAADLVSPITPCFVAAYGAQPEPRMPRREELLTIVPSPVSSMAGIWSRMHIQTPLRFTSAVWSHCSSVMVSHPSVRRPLSAALLNAQSSRPYSDRVSSTMFSTSEHLATSV